jgi:hypothetical protein
LRKICSVVAEIFHITNVYDGTAGWVGQNVKEVILDVREVILDVREVILDVREVIMELN